MILTQAKVPYEIAAREWKRHGFRDSYAWHKRVWEAFPGKPDAQRDFLTRLDDMGDYFRLLILSPDPPTRPNWCPADKWESKTIGEAFFSHHRYQFSLLANPTKKLKATNSDGISKKNGRREPIRKREHLLEWIQNKGALHGFEPELNTIKTVPRPRQDFYVTKKKMGGTHSAIEFSGMLKVVEPLVFKKAATKGIGSAKAFGFGMLCLIPLHD